MKRLVFIFVALFLFLPLVRARELPVDITADAAILINLDEEETIYEKNADKQEILASLTKVMSAYTVLQRVDNLNRKVTIRESDISNLDGFTCAGLEVGSSVSYLDLLYAMILPSGADASKALAIHVAGSEEKFKNMMNEEVEKLGLRYTHFEDSYGGDDNNVSTARDYSILLREALKNKTFKKVFSSNHYTLSNGLEVFNYTRNYAIYHGLDPDLITGNKSGYTPEAGLLLASTATINGVNYALVICKAQENEKLSQHVLDTYKVYDYVSNHHYEKRTLIEKGAVLGKINVVDGTTSEYVITAQRNITKVLSDEDFEEVNYDYNLASELTSKNKIGDNLGYVDILVGDDVIATYNVNLKDQLYDKKVESKKMVVVIIVLGFVILVLLCANLFSVEKVKK